jgi:DNA mismatch endonuclease (patch repair protein)
MFLPKRKDFTCLVHEPSQALWNFSRISIMQRRIDSVSPEKRSEIMRAVKGRGNMDTELVLIRLLRQNKITGWRRSQPIFGKPDFIFPKHELAIFVDGCFWHGCSEHCRMPKGNRAYWKQKIASNKARDRLVNRTLRAQGWRALRIWEHELAKHHETRLLRLAGDSRKIVPCEIV